MKVSATFTITDEPWPRLSITINKEVDGKVVVETKKVLYDQAYLQFETTLQNTLRPMVQHIIEQRKKNRSRTTSEQ